MAKKETTEAKEKQNAIKISVRETEPLIKKIKLQDGGSNGLEVTYSTMEVRNSVLSQVEMVKKQKRPVQKELRNYFLLLREHLLKGTGYYWNNQTTKDMLESTIVVNYVVVEDQLQFQIGGKKTVGDYTIALNTALMDSENYDWYDEGDKGSVGLGEILTKIRMEAKLFMSGAKGADSRQVVVDYMLTKKEIADPETEWAKLSLEDRKKMEHEAFGYYGLEFVEEDGELVVGVKEDEKAPSVMEVATQMFEQQETKESVFVPEEKDELSFMDEEAIPENPVFNVEDDFDLPL